MFPRLFSLQGPLSFPLQVLEALTSVFNLPKHRTDTRPNY